MKAYRRQWAVAISLVAGLLLVARAHAVHNCTGCPSLCTIDCSGSDSDIESDFRNAVAYVNANCTNVTISFSSCNSIPIPKNVIKLTQTSGVATCANGICLDGSGITIDGAGRTFEYVGSQNCCSDQVVCGANHRLFTVRGNGNRVQNLKQQYFPEGIHVEDLTRPGATPTPHLISNVSSDVICEDSISVEGAQTVVTISGGTMTGHTPAPPIGDFHYQDCHNNNNFISDCGLDKGIQLNAGKATVSNVTFINVRAPVKVSGGDHLIQFNNASGSTSDSNLCQAFELGDDAVNNGPLIATFRGNTITACKFSIDSKGTFNDPVYVIAENNTIIDALRSGFHIGGTAFTYVKGEGNMIRNYGTAPAGNPIGAILVETANAKVDFGGGDHLGGCINIPGKSALCSNGKNSFCGTSAKTDVHHLATASTGAKFSCWGQENSIYPVAIDTIGSNIETGGVATSCLSGVFTPCAPTATATRTPTATATRTPTATATRTPTATNTPAGTSTNTATATRTSTITPTPSITPTPTITPTTTRTGTATNTSTPTRTSTVTSTSTVTPTRTNTGTVTPTSTITPTASVTSTASVTPTATLTKTATPTNTPTVPICGGAPSSGCHAPGSGDASILLDSNGKLTWKWKRGETLAAEFGDPRQSTTYALCLYDSSAVPLRMEARVPAGLASQASWTRSPSDSGEPLKKWRYVDKKTLPQPHGIRLVKLRPGEITRARIDVKGKGSSIPLPPLPLTGPVTVELRTSSGSCWSAHYSMAYRNDVQQYRARSDEQ